jgi:hypothetical protein
MSPIDDELRSLLHSRADGVAAAPDPLGGVERRAKKMRRNRLAASVAGSAVVVAAIAVAVPSLVPDRNDASSVATTPSPDVSVAPSPTTAGSYGPNDLDPAHPWTYRGDPGVVAGNELATLQSEWAAAHPGATVSPLYGEVYEPSRRPQVTFVSTGGGADRWGVATTSEAGWTFVYDAALPAGTTVLMAALAADEVPRLLIVAAPTTGQIEYAKDGETFAPLTGVAADIPGVAYAPLEGDTSKDVVRVLDGNGDIDHPVFIGPAPDVDATGMLRPDDAHPANYLEWQTRGTVDARTESQAVSAFARAKGTTDDQVGHHVLWGGTDKAGRKLIFMEAWVGTSGPGMAQTFGFVSTGEPFLGPAIGPRPDVLAYLASGAPGTGTDVLVILPRLGAGTFSYAKSSTAPYQEVGNARSDLQNVAVIDRDPKATSDRLKVLDGDGMKVLYDGPVQPLLCGESGCG